MLLHDVTSKIQSQITGETKERYLRLLSHGERFNEPIQIVSVGASDGIMYVCIGGMVRSGVGVSISYNDEDSFPIVLDRAINQLVDEYCSAFNAQFGHRSINL